MPSAPAPSYRAATFRQKQPKLQPSQSASSYVHPRLISPYGPRLARRGQLAKPGCARVQHTLNTSLMWTEAKAPSLAEMEAMAHEVFERLPKGFRTLCAGVIIRVDDFPTDEVLEE